MTPNQAAQSAKTADAHLDAIPVDPEGPTTWDASEWVAEFLAASPERAARWLAWTLEHGDHDDILRTDPNAPRWIREWHGPFDTYLERIA